MEPITQGPNDQAISRDFMFLARYLEISTRAPVHYRAATEAEECLQRIHVALRGARFQIIEGGKPAPVEPRPAEEK